MRGRWVGGLALVLGLLGSIGPMAPPPLAAARAPAAAPLQPAVVQMATVESGGNAGFYIAMERGYFAEQGITLDLTKFATGIDYVPALARGQVDVATTDLSAGIVNVFTRDIPIKMVADRGSLPPGGGWQAILLRPDLVDRVRDYRDLRGLRFGISFEGAFSQRVIGQALELGGLTVADAEFIILPSGDVPAALGNRALDATVVFEPQVTIAVEQGFAVRWRGVDEVLPDSEAVVISYGPQFASRTDLARRWMAAYLKGVRDYNDACRGGPNRAEIVGILTRTTPIRDPALWDRLVWTAIDPNGRVNTASILETQAWYRRNNMLQGDVDLRPFVDSSFAEWAVQQLGPYQGGRACPSAG